MIRSNLSVVLRITVCLISNLCHFFSNCTLQQTNINANCTLFLSVRQKRERLKSIDRSFISSTFQYGLRINVCFVIPVFN